MTRWDRTAGYEWPQNVCDALTLLWGLGMSATDIAGELTKAYRNNITRNMVIGKAHRLGLPKRPSPIRRAA